MSDEIPIFVRIYLGLFLTPSVAIGLAMLAALVRALHEIISRWKHVITPYSYRAKYRLLGVDINWNFRRDLTIAHSLSVFQNSFVRTRINFIRDLVTLKSNPDDGDV